MNNKAFSLIEILAVIVLLSVLSTLVIINVTKYMERAEETSYNTLVKSVKEATELYVADHSTNYPELNTEGATFDIELNKLVEEGYIDDELVDERSGENIPLTTKIYITVINKNKIDVEFGV